MRKFQSLFKINFSQGEMTLNILKESAKEYYLKNIVL